MAIETHKARTQGERSSQRERTEIYDHMLIEGTLDVRPSGTEEGEFDMYLRTAKEVQVVSDSKGPWGYIESKHDISVIEQPVNLKNGTVPSELGLPDRLLDKHFIEWACDKTGRSGFTE
jgi:hypothetical protein